MPKGWTIWISDRILTGKGEAALTACLPSKNTCSILCLFRIYTKLRTDPVRIADAISEVLKAMNIKSTILYSAPTMILVSSMELQAPGIDYANAGCILENMVIAATDKEVDSVIFGAAAMAVRAKDELRVDLGIPDGFNPLLSIALGYAAVPDEPVKEHKIAVNRA